MGEYATRRPLLPLTASEPRAGRGHDEQGLQLGADDALRLGDLVRVWVRVRVWVWARVRVRVRVRVRFRVRVRMRGLATPTGIGDGHIHPRV